MMMDRMLSRLLIASLMAGATLMFGSTASAQDQDQETARETGPVVRHQLLYRSTRFEAAPVAGITVGDAYTRNAMAGLSLSYHLTNSLGLGLFGAGGFAQFGTDLRDNVESEIGGDDLSYSQLNGVASLELSYAPIIGKYSFFNSAITDFDVHLIGGVGLAFEGAEAAVEDGQIDAGLEGTRPGPVVGAGARFFLSDGVAANLQVRDYLFSRSEVSTQSSDAEFQNNVLVTLGLSFFLPQEVKISR